jgi:subtilisin family serine protease
MEQIGTGMVTLQSAKHRPMDLGITVLMLRSMILLPTMLPQYLICIAAGNARGYNGPPIDSPYLYNGGSSLLRSATLANNPNFASVSNAADSKNTLVVGAVNGIPGGYSSPSDVVIADFSSLGPTNDGRIKPDVVADGVNVTSTWNTSNTAYSTQSGTSMATPNTTGSLYLLQEYYNQLHPSTFMRAATLRGLAIHTADQTGTSPGPNYTFGWGSGGRIKRGQCDHILL